jgi:predicted alpha/beta-fold hydrolase
MRRKVVGHPDRFSLAPLRGVRTVRQFDAVYTAPHFGFASAEDYYHRASAMRVIDRIRVPALVVAAEDDPFVPAEIFRDSGLTGNPHIELHLLRHGGHCGFLGDAIDDDDGYWAEQRVVSFARSVVQEKGVEGR